MNKKARTLLTLSNLLRLCATVIVLGLIGLMGYLIYQQFDQSKLQVTFYSMQSDKVTSNVRILQLSDIHGKEFGKDNERLVERVRSLEPDIIAITGDMVTQGRDDYPVMTTLVKQLSAIAPTYYSFGNHEYEDFLFNNQKRQVWNTISAAGAEVLNCTSGSITVGENEIVVGGICVSNATFDNREVKSFLREFSAESKFTLLLTHYPEIFDGNMDAYPVDLALAGHEHGGQIRVPVLGPLYSETQGFFPKLADGKITTDNYTLVISRGLGNSHIIPRVNNEPEIVVVDVNWY